MRRNNSNSLYPVCYRFVKIFTYESYANERRCVYIHDYSRSYRHTYIHMHRGIQVFTRNGNLFIWYNLYRHLTTFAYDKSRIDSDPYMLPKNFNLNISGILLEIPLLNNHTV